MLAPPWISVPPPGYGGVETVVSVLTEALVQRGHHVTLFCAPGSTSTARVTNLLSDTHPDEIERSLFDVDHVARAFAEIDRGEHGPFEVVHDHCGFTGLAMADRLGTPLLHTLHGQFTSGTTAFYARHGHKATLVGISRAQLALAPPSLGPVATIPNPIHLAAWPLQESKQDYVVGWAIHRREGPAPRHRRRACRRGSAGAGRRGPARTTGLLCPRDRSAR
jgi:glycosyltransferase involved in cell wall biosynthesis